MGEALPEGGGPMILDRYEMVHCQKFWSYIMAPGVHHRAVLAPLKDATTH